MSEQTIEEQVELVLRQAIDLSLSIEHTLPQHKEHVKKTTAKVTALIKEAERLAIVKELEFLDERATDPNEDYPLEHFIEKHLAELQSKKEES